MKKTKNLLIILIMGMILFIPHIKTNAEEIFTNASEVIKQKNDLMVWTNPRSEDFEVIGDLKYNNQIYKADDVILGVPDYYIRDISNNEITLYISIKNTSITFSQKISLTVIPFNPNLKCTIENQTLKINKIRWKSEDGSNTINYYDDLNVRMETVTHTWVVGEIKFSDNYYNPQIGYNDVTYKFIPSDNKFNTTSGKFTIFYDKKPTIKRYTDHLIINGLNRENYDIYVNGKKYKITYINNLKSKTNYKIKIYQKATDTRKKTLLYTLNVTTK